MGRPLKARHKVSKAQLRAAIETRLERIEKRLERAIEVGNIVTIKNLAARMNTLRAELYHLGA